MPSKTTHSKPNILIINPDQMRADALHHLGNAASYTPNLDRLAYEGVSFANAFCQNPVCVPSRCSFMTGLYPHTNGHRTMSHLLQPDEENLFSDMKQAGYYTVSSARGDLMAGQYKDYHRRCIDSYLMYGKVSTPVSLPKTKRDGSDGCNDFYDGMIPPRKNGKVCHGDDLCIDAAVRAICNRPKEKPFFMFVGLQLPHPPYAVEQKYYDMIDASVLQERIPTIADTDGKPKMETGLRDAQRLDKRSEQQLREIRRTYLAMCAKVDDQIGRLVRTLKAEGIYNNTAVLVLSDHGDYTGDYGIVEKCQNCFPDCLVNVPFLIKPPKGIVADSGINENLVQLNDLCATVYDLAGIDAPRLSFSQSLLPTLQDKTKAHRSHVFCEGGRLCGETHCSEMNLFLNENDRYAARQLLQAKEDGTHTKAVMIRTKDYKYVYRLYEEDEFYDLQQGERHNLIAEERYAPIVEELKKQMLDWYVQTCDSVPTRYDDRFTDEFLANNIASIGVPMPIVKAFTSMLTMTGKTATQAIDGLRKLVKM